MASVAPSIHRESLVAGLARRDLAIVSPRIDAIFFWGAPFLAFALIVAIGAVTTLVPPAAGDTVTRATIAAVAVLTYAHLIAVAPRAYLNRDVLSAHRARLTVVPIVLLAAMALSPAALVVGMIAAAFWDVHHSAMQTFGLGRIYDMKAGNDPVVLRRVDLWLNAALYIGPIAAGAAMLVAFVAIRAVNGYGEPVPWTTGATPVATVMSFLNLTKYPPSLDFLLLTLGIGTLILAGWEGRGGGVLAVLGGAPLFFYLLHLYALHLARLTWGGTGDVPLIAWIWGIAALATPPLWVATRWFAGVKRRSDRWWIRYL